MQMRAKRTSPSSVFRLPDGSFFFFLVSASLISRASSPVSSVRAASCASGGQ